MTQVALHGVSKRYGSHAAVDDLTLTMQTGELVALVGASGCGKTTTLRMVAGFVSPSAGRIEIGGQDVTNLAPNRRDIGLVFQSYALFPHFTVAENIAFGLRRRGRPGAEISARVSQMIATMKLDGLAARYPGHLSGGQQQRVAVARALVINPSVLLLDEPFSNLDAKLREGTALEMRRLQTELGITTLFVTHDQHEAMAMADRVAVMNRGKIEQIGTGPEIYRRPATLFVAGFIGSASFLNASIIEAGDRNATIDCAGTRFCIETRRPVGPVGSPAHFMVRPELVRLADAGKAGDWTARIEARTFQGASMKLGMRLMNGELLLAEMDGSAFEHLQQGDEVRVQIDCSKAALYDAAGNLA